VPKQDLDGKFSECTTTHLPRESNKTVLQEKPVNPIQPSLDMQQASSDNNPTQADSSLPKDPFIIELCAGSAVQPVLLHVYSTLACLPPSASTTLSNKTQGVS